MIPLPPWVRLCRVCGFRYSLSEVCPVCRERAEWKHENRRAKIFTLCLTLVVTSTWVLLLVYLISRLP